MQEAGGLGEKEAIKGAKSWVYVGRVRGGGGGCGVDDLGSEPELVLYVFSKNYVLYFRMNL